MGATALTTHPTHRLSAIFRDIVITTASTRNLMLLSRPFRSAGMLESLLKQLGFQMQVVHISRGPLQGHLSATRSAGGLLLQLTTNQCLSCSGSRNQRWLAIALEQTNNLEMHRLRGKPKPPSMLCSLNASCDRTTSRLPAYHSAAALN